MNGHKIVASVNGAVYVLDDVSDCGNYWESC